MFALSGTCRDSKDLNSSCASGCCGKHLSSQEHPVSEAFAAQRRVLLRFSIHTSSAARLADRVKKPGHGKAAKVDTSLGLAVALAMCPLPAGSLQTARFAAR